MSDNGTKRRAIRAQSLVEFALIGPVFLLMVFGLIEGARLVYAYNTVNHAAQEAARTAVLADTASESAVKDRAVEAADPLTVQAGSVDVEVNDGGTAFADRDIGDRVEVTVGYDFVPVVGMVFGSTTAIGLTGKTALMVE
jgi:Flp pilus assembly protein TadG